MGIRLKKLVVYIKPTILLILLFISFLLLAEALIRRPDIQSYIIKRISDATGYRITVRRMSINVWHGLGVALSGVEIDSYSKAFALNSVKARVIFNWKRLFRKDVVPVAIYLDRPTFVIKKKESATSINAEQALKRALGFVGSSLRTKIRFMSVNNGKLLVERSGWQSQDIVMSLWSTEDGMKRLMGRFKVLSPYGAMKLSLKGELGQIKKGIIYPSIKGRIQIEDFPLSLVPKLDVMKIKSGLISCGVMDIYSRQGKDLSLKLNGELRVKDIKFSIQKNNNKTERFFSFMNISFLSQVREHTLRFPSFVIGLPDTRLFGKAVFSFNDMKDPEISIMVNTNWMDIKTFKDIFPGPIVSSWFDRVLFPLLKSGFVRVNNFSLNGRLSKIKRIKRAQNRDALNLSISFKKMVFKSEEQDIPFTGISGELNLSNGNLWIRDVSSQFGKSSIGNGRLKITSLFTDNRLYEAGFEGDFRLNEVFSLKGVSWLPASIISPVSVISGVTGGMKGGVEFFYSSGGRGFGFKKINLALNDAIFSLIKLKNPLIVRNGNIIVEEDREKRIFNADISIDKNSMELSGRLVKSGRFYSIGLLKVAGQVIPSQLLSIFESKRDLKIISTTKWNITAEVEKQEDSWHISGELNPAPFAFLFNKDLSIYFPWDKSQFNFNFVLRDKRRLKINKLIYSINDSKLMITGLIPLGGDLSGFSLNFRSPALHVDGLRLLFREKDFLFKGTLKLDINLREKDRPGLLITGPIRGTDFYVSLKDSGTIFSCPLVSVEFSGEKLTIHEMDLSFNGNDFKVKGALSGWKRPRGKIELTSEQFIIKKNGGGMGFKVGALDFLKQREMDIHSKIFIKKGNIKGFPFAPLRAELVLKNGRIYLTYFDLKSPHAEMRLTGNFKEKPTPGVIFYAYIKIQDQPAEEIFSALGKKDDPLIGKVDFEAFFYSEGEDLQGILSNLSGSANILIKNGRVKKSNMFIKILEILSINKVFERVPEDMEKEGFYFKSMGCSGTIEKGVFLTDNFLLKSPVFNGAGSGKIDLKNNSIDGNIGIAPFKTLDSIVGHIPIIGHILTGKNKALITYYFKVGGSISEPEVRYVPFKNMGKGVASMIRKMLLSPIWVFKKIPKPKADSQEEESVNDITTEED